MLEWISLNTSHLETCKNLEKRRDPCFSCRISAFLASSDDIPNFHLFAQVFPNSVNRQNNLYLHLSVKRFSDFVEFLFLLLLLYKSFCCSMKYLLNGNVCICFGGNSFVSCQESDRISLDNNRWQWPKIHRRHFFGCDIYSTIVDVWIHEIFQMKIKWNFAPWSEMTTLNAKRIMENTPN